MNDNFMLFQKAKDLALEILEYSKNIPKNMTEVKIEMQKSAIASVRNIRCYMINLNESDRIKFKYLKDLVVELSMTDFYLESLHKYGLLGINKFNYFSSKLEEVKKIAYGVIASEKK